ncbi:MAG TPA: hypothetical protein PL168_06175 [Methanobacterium sp.]|nr:hypothetical protein [Methanobacterium sp.]
MNDIFRIFKNRSSEKDAITYENDERLRNIKRIMDTTRRKGETDH